MSYPSSAGSAYGGTSAVRTARETEAEVFRRSIAALNRAKTDRDTNPGAFHSALHDNRLLWMHLAAEVANSASPLPVETRGAILSLSDFVLRHSDKVVFENAEIDPLIDVNLKVWRGLTGQKVAA